MVSFVAGLADDDGTVTQETSLLLLSQLLHKELTVRDSGHDMQQEKSPKEKWDQRIFRLCVSEGKKKTRNARETIITWFLHK